MTKPTIGQPVLFWPARTDHLFPGDGLPLHAVVCGSPEGDTVNLAVTDRNGEGSTSRRGVKVIDAEPKNADTSAVTVAPAGAKTIDAGVSPLQALEARIVEAERKAGAAKEAIDKAAQSTGPARDTPAVTALTARVAELEKQLATLKLPAPTVPVPVHPPVVPQPH